MPVLHFRGGTQGLAEPDTATLHRGEARVQTLRQLSWVSRCQFMELRMAICGECKFWQCTDGLPNVAGECRRFPPTRYNYLRASDEGMVTVTISWPGTRQNDWCGEFTAITP